jgi:hypothetical protein
MFAVFEVSELMRHKYDLHSILIHDGNADGGHYWAYIYDHTVKRWRKYNDMLITEVDEQEVFTKSIGGDGQTSAYYFIYTKSEGIGTQDLYRGYRLFSESSMLVEEDAKIPEVLK